jgi:F1F0 ATPase subunit 2
MNEMLAGLLAGAAGALLGALFFGGLWWTVHRGIASDRPVLWFLGSLFVRSGIALCGIYLVSDGNVMRLLVCLLGFAMARPVVVWLSRPSRDDARRPVRGAPHAS